jgi:acyl-CoA reductase-like NAD-dependent aldehyde dehydrogenase
MAKAIIKKQSINLNGNGINNSITEKRLEVLKTYKIYIGGQFPRTESGRYYVATNLKNEKLANVCLSSRKDFRDAVVSARGAFGGWAGRAAFNRGQILYRIAEMLEGRKAQFIEELVKQIQQKFRQKMK